MPFRSIAAKKVVLWTIAVMIAAAAVRAQSPTTVAKPPAPANVRLPDESAGLDAIARTLVSVFDQVDIVALGEAHGRKLDSDLRIAVVRHPDFARKVRSIVVEFGSTTEQATLDRYIRGENISPAQLAQVWRTTTPARPPNRGQPNLRGLFRGRA